MYLNGRPKDRLQCGQRRVTKGVHGPCMPANLTTDAVGNSADEFTTEAKIAAKLPGKFLR